jgi:hypothetical protein
MVPALVCSVVVLALVSPVRQDDHLARLIVCSVLCAVCSVLLRYCRSSPCFAVYLRSSAIFFARRRVSVVSSPRLACMVRAMGEALGMCGLDADDHFCAIRTIVRCAPTLPDSFVLSQVDELSCCVCAGSAGGRSRSAQGWGPTLGSGARGVRRRIPPALEI